MKPRASPLARVANCRFPTNPAVRYPRAARYSASVGYWRSSGTPQLAESSRGERPVKKLAWEGGGHGARARVRGRRRVRGGKRDAPMGGELEGRAAGEEARVGGEGPRRGRDGAVERHRPPGEGVQRRRGGEGRIA